ncbi:MAG: hypothetical protein HC853_14895 [Anaerolineae bacterium]|nr:hypothetical protein [Anaerolineae bacterium]
MDWAQALSRRGATFIGNTGYGYGDASLIAYSERLSLQFATIINQRGSSAISVGEALKRAKHEYFNTLGEGSLSNYDEKVLAQWTLFGLPMRSARVPASQSTDTTGPSMPQHIQTAPVQLDANLVAITRTIVPTLTGRDTVDGRYYQASNDAQILSGRPTQPRTYVEIGFAGTRAHGVLLIGGSIRDETLNPVVTRIITDDTYIAQEPEFDSAGFYPARIATVNSLLGLDGRYAEKLVLVPGQFRPTSVTPTTGQQRLWERLDVVTYHAPYTVSDFVEPTLNLVRGWAYPAHVNFTVGAADLSGIQRVTVLYRALDMKTWSLVELQPHTTLSDTWSASISRPSAGVEYIAQVVDTAGNVALRSDYGNPFRPVVARSVYLPLARR